MQSEAMEQLVGSGNTATVEDEWMRLIESQDSTPDRLAGYRCVLKALCECGRRTTAETLAWAAIEAVQARVGGPQTLAVAGSFLLSIPDSKELRTQVTELYRSVHADCEGLEALLIEAGLPGGRPVRRAVRTLDVCLEIKEGDFLAARDDGGAARVDEIDREAWEYSIVSQDGPETLGAVHLADRYRPAAAEEFQVLLHFSRDALLKRLKSHPASMVVDICRANGNSITSEQLAEMLVGELLTEAEWKKWWTRARTTLKKHPDIRVEGRLPYTITYDDAPIDYEAEMLAEFEREREPEARYAVVEKYVRACPGRGTSPDRDALTKCYETLREQAADLVSSEASRAGLVSTMAWRVGQGVEAEDAGALTEELIRTAEDIEPIFSAIRDDNLIDLACSALETTRPDAWCDLLTGVLPILPQSYCDRAVERLTHAGRTAAELAPVVQRIVASPVAHFGALCWLWDGPKQDGLLGNMTPVTVLSRILRALSDCKRSDTMPREQIKAIGAQAKTVLAARKYERFMECLETVDSGMALALRNQIAQLDNLGRVVHDTLLSRIQSRIPKSAEQVVVPLWAREDLLFTTSAGLKRKQEEIDHHVNVKMKENARAIGAAAEKGDLSENSEYKFALEERDLLRARLAQMNSEMQAAKVLQPADVPTDMVGVGTRVVFRRIGDGAPYEMAFVGPWDADHDEARFNYQAPLGQSLMGSRVGDVVSLNHAGASGEYEIVSLHNSLEP